MKSIDSPQTLAAALVELFPQFSAELDEEDLQSYHAILIYLANVITGYLVDAPEKKAKAFAEIVNAMVLAGGIQENAVSTCLLEHASQIKLKKLIKRFSISEAKKELR